MAIKTLKELFGVNSQQTLEVPDVPAKYRASEISNYQFRVDALRDMMVFWRLGRRACMLSGHKGCGKTSLVEQYHLRLNRNLLSVTGNGKTNLEALFGQYVLNEQGNLVWQDGPVTVAARNGYSVIINEFNAIPEDVQIALNDVLHEGAPFTLPEKAEQFMPADGFRLFATINPKGASDFMYRGRKEMDAALKERFFWIGMDYGNRREEEAIVAHVWQTKAGLEEEDAMVFAKQLVNVAEAVRMKSKETNASAIPEIISTRVLVNWAEYWIAYQKQNGSVHIGLQRALTFGCRPEVAYQIHKLVAIHTNVPSPYDSEFLNA